jgi:HK97 gp10 family phage protein
MINVTFNYKRDFTKLARFMLTFFPSAKRKLNRIALEVMEKTEADLKRAIVDKDRSSFIKRLRKISPKWVQEKLSKGQKPQQLAGTLSYAAAIHVIKGDDELTLTIKKGQYPGRNISYTDLARFLEFGTVNMKPLPHWRKAAKFFKKEMKKRVKEEFKHVSFSG